MAERPKATPRWLAALLRGLSTAEAVLGGLLLVVLLLLVLLQAVQRYLPAGGWVWTGELARLCLVWLTFAMAGYLAGRDGHVTLKLIDQAARGAAHRLVLIFANAMVAIVCVNLAYEAFLLAIEPSQAVTPALELPRGLMYVIPCVGMVLTTIRSVVAIFVPPAPQREEPA